MMTRENSPRAISAVPARSWPRRPTPSRDAAYWPLTSFVAAVTAARAQAAGSRQQRHEFLRIDRQSDAEEEDRREQIPQRAEHGPGPVGALARQAQPDEEGPDSRGGMDDFGQRRNDQGQTQHPEQELLGVRV